MAAKRDNYSSVEELLLKTPLYEELSITARGTIVRGILTFIGTIDTYCTGCGQNATFRGEVSADTARAEQLTRAAVGVGPRPNLWDKREVSKALVCTRRGHRITYHFVCEDDHLVKVGQFPSLADIQIGDTDKYEPVLGRERLKEFNRAIGLVAHGVGIGAHVYLRRIFESLVEDARQVAAKGEGWDELKYQQARMAERIGLLKQLLPQFLAENPRLYALLSKGVHELTEDECLANFDALKVCVEVILDQKLAEKYQGDKAEAAKKALAKIDGGAKPHNAA